MSVGWRTFFLWILPELWWRTQRGHLCFRYSTLIHVLLGTKGWITLLLKEEIEHIFQSLLHRWMGWKRSWIFSRRIQWRMMWGNLQLSSSVLCCTVSCVLLLKSSQSQISAWKFQLRQELILFCSCSDSDLHPVFVQLGGRDKVLSLLHESVVKPESTSARVCTFPIACNES